MTKTAIVFPGLLFACMLFAAENNANPRADDEIVKKARAVIQERVDRHQDRFGIVLGVIDEQGTRIVAYGRANDSMRVKGDSMFNLGSVAKLFTATLLADMVERGEVCLDDEIDRFLPPGVKTPSRKGRKITLLDLATHTSGLPSTPGNSSEGQDGRPGYCDYSEKQLYAFLSGYRLTRDIGTEYEYSNLGMGLLGFLLSRQAGKSLDDLLAERIWRPLQMRRTGTREELSRLYPQDMTVSYHASGEAAVECPMSPVLKGAGGYYSAVPDMLTFLGANMGRISSSLAKAMQRTQQGYRGTGSPGGEVGLGWGISKTATEHCLTHSGGSAAYSSFVGINKTLGRGVVILGNSYFEVVDIGLAVLVDRLEMPAADQPAAATDYVAGPEQRAAWRDFTGLYEMAPGLNIMVTMDKERLVLQLPRQPGLVMSASGEASFVVKQGEVEARVRFLKDEQGRTVALEMKQGAVKGTMKKIPEPPTVSVDPLVLDACTGLFEIEADLRVEITREKDGLYAQATMQPKVRIFPASETEFFSMLDDLRISFVPDGKGERNELLFQYRGRKKQGVRVQGKKAATLDAAKYKDYVGRYQVTPRFILTVTTENGRLFVQGSYQPVFELFPEGGDAFFVRTMDVKVRFQRDPGGRVIRIVVTTAGGDETGNRIES